MTATVIRKKTNKTSRCVPRFSTKKKSYEYAEGYAHRASRIGDRFYKYDANGNVLAEQDAPFTDEPKAGSPEVKDAGGGAYYVEGAWGMPGGGNEGTGGAQSKIYRRDYKWDERNRLKESADPRYTVKYTYGHDGERTGKYSFGTGSESETLYFNKMWTWRYDGLLSDRTGNNSKHIFLGETRIATKISYADGYFIAGADQVKQYWYHSDHLGSAQLITNYKGEEYERLEYTPYGELWIEKASAVSQIDIPYRFTGKERDSETGLYYYGARYLDPKTARWLSGDPAMGEYVPAPGQDAGKLPGVGGIFNYVNFHAYHYGGNNPIKYIDPNGRSDDDKVAEIRGHLEKDPVGRDILAAHDNGLLKFEAYDSLTYRTPDGEEKKANGFCEDNTIGLDFTRNVSDIVKTIFHENEHFEQNQRGDNRPLVDREVDAHIASFEYGFRKMGTTMPDSIRDNIENNVRSDLGSYGAGEYQKSLNDTHKLEGSRPIRF
ncbi:MAG: RHS repeat-associated core domain-containing protein [Treponema sp.]|nr:RHS repeat-associated core domain-containing protein [Treponema sp.]